MYKLIIFTAIAFSFTASFSQCESARNFGIKEICLPTIIGMTECYDDPLVELYVDQFKGSEDEVIIGMYLLDDIFDNRYMTFFEDGCGDDYIKMFSLESVKDVYADKEALEIVFTSMTSNFLSDNSDAGFNKIMKTVENRLLKTGILESFEVGVPTVIEKYELNSSTKNCMLITKMIVDDYKFVQVQSFNLILLQNRLLLYVYYKTYEGPESIKLAKQNSDFFGYTLISKNKTK